jgi:hypothetical protein
MSTFFAQPNSSDQQRQQLMSRPFLEFSNVLAQPRCEQTPEGQLLRFQFGNGYGALVMEHTYPDGSEHTFELCLMDCTREPARPTFEHLLCPEVLFGLELEQVSEVLVKAERLARHPRLTHVDKVLMGEDF